MIDDGAVWQCPKELQEVSDVSVYHQLTDGQVVHDTATTENTSSVSVT